MKPLSKTHIWILSICLTVLMGAMKAEEVKQEEVAQQHLKESIALAKKDKAEQNKKLKQLYLEAQEKTGFPVVQR